MRAYSQTLEGFACGFPLPRGLPLRIPLTSSNYMVRSSRDYVLPCPARRVKGDGKPGGNESRDFFENTNPREFRGYRFLRLSIPVRWVEAPRETQGKRFENTASALMRKILYSSANTYIYWICRSYVYQSFSMQLWFTFDWLLRRLARFKHQNVVQHSHFITMVIN